MEQQRREARERRRWEAEVSLARFLSQRLSETHTPRDLERMDPLPSSPVGRMNRIEARAAAQQPLSPTVNQGLDFSPASWQELSPESHASLMPRTSSPAGVGIPARQPIGLSPVPTARGPISRPPPGRQPTQGMKQPRQRAPGGGSGGGGGDDGSGPTNGRDDTPRSRRSGVPSDRGDLQDAFEQMSDRERERLRKKNVQSVTHTTVYKDGRPPSATRESRAPNQNSV